MNMEMGTNETISDCSRGMMSDEDIILQLEASMTPGMKHLAEEVPWFYRTMPGRTGNFLGHAIPASFFLGFSVFILLLSLKRARALGQQSFSQVHIPERDPLVLRRVGIGGMIVTVIGLIVEMSGSYAAFGNPFGQLAHETLYFSFFLVSLCAFLETKGRLPPDTHRAALIMAFVSSYLMWHSHGTMKKLMADQIMHILLSYINLSNAAIVAYSMRFTDSTMAYIGGYAMLVLQSFWLFTAGLYESCFNLPMHEIATYLAVESLLVFMVIVVVFAMFGPEQSLQDNPSYRGNFAPLKLHGDDDHDDEPYDRP
ncbi:expressed unknown protein [Seminavis robusta]|uniref:Uncharacterized protein n=1 Tax=Seminavis robusta TaxID=568900 RepID=A0A9N8D8X8_9STRA|nr:expressed unknown protein [Seminavis robusta]|eukprot:Sro40_g024460.1 n/a (312) ;mRNA; f:8180-9229